MSCGSGWLKWLGILLLSAALSAIVVPVFTPLTVALMYPGIILLTAGLLCLVGHHMKAADSRRTMILSQGIPGEARIIKWWILGKSDGSPDMVERCMLSVQVSLDGIEPFKTEVKELLPHSTFSELHPGMILKVMADPDDHSRIILVGDHK